MGIVWMSATNMSSHSNVVGSTQCRSSMMNTTGCCAALRKGIVISARMVCCFCCSGAVLGEADWASVGMANRFEKSGIVSASGRPLSTKKPSSLESFCAAESCGSNRRTIRSNRSISGYSAVCW